MFIYVYVHMYMDLRVLSFLAFEGLPSSKAWGCFPTNFPNICSNSLTES